LRYGIGKEHNLSSTQYVCQGQTLEIDTTWLTIASMVIGGDVQSVEDVKNQIPNHYLYEYLDTYLSLNFNYFQSEFSNKEVNNIWLNTINYNFSGHLLNTGDSEAIAVDKDNKISYQAIKTRLPISNPYPDYYYFCSLFYANNNWWQNDQEPGEDLGKRIILLKMSNNQFICKDSGIRYWE
jgi:hypothetical protein